MNKELHSTFKLPKCLLTLMLFGAIFGKMNAATYTVTTTADAGVGSLRDQIAAASAGDQIVFSAAINGSTITLTSGHIVINKNLIITGPGYSLLTISGNHSSRIFEISANVSVSGLKISNGFTSASGEDGGGIRASAGKLILKKIYFENDTAVSNNGTQGGAVYYGVNTGVFYADSCFFYGCRSDNYGGALACNAGPDSVKINSCQFNGNKTGAYGILMTNANYNKITNSTFSNNYSTGNNSTIGIIGNNPISIFQSCTFSNNQAAFPNAVLFARGGNMNIVNCTFKNNNEPVSVEAAMFGPATVMTMQNCILNNSGANISVSGFPTPAVTSNGGNISSDGSASAYFISTNDLNNTNPLLGPLANNGGIVQTHQLLIGSPAINNGISLGAPITDQIGNARNGIIDAGSLEFIPAVAAAALNFDGANDRVNLGSAITTSLTGSTKVSIEAWVKPTSLSGLGCIVGNYSSGSAALQILLRRSGNSFYEFWVGNGGTWYNTNSVATPTLNVWQHVAATWDGTVASIYVNGVLSGTTTPAISTLGNASNNPVWIGSNTLNENFTGNIDEVRIWNVARTQCDINTYKNCEIPTTATGLIANYHFNQGVDGGTNTSVTTLTDASTSSFTGTLTNMALTGTTSNWVAPGGVVSGSVTPAVLTPAVGSTVSNSVICSGNSTTLSGTGANTYNWTNGVTNAAVFSPTVTATYTVTGTNTLTGCSNTAINTITVNALPTITVSSGAVCAGQSYTINANGASTYTSVPSLAGPVVTPTATTSYSITGTDANGCVSSNTAVSTVTVNNLPTISVNSGTICSGNSFTMIPSGASTYTYSNGSSVATPTANASYNVTGTDINGCISSSAAVSSVTVNALPMVMASTNSTLLCTGQTASLTASGATSYTWNTSATTAIIAVSPTTTATYTVNGTSANGCSNVATVTQNVSSCLGIAILSNDAAIKLYPNPNNGLFIIELTSLSKVTVTNALGQIVIAETFEAGNHNLDIINQSNGVYFVKIIENNKQQIIKVIKQ